MNAWKVVAVIWVINIVLISVESKRISKHLRKLHSIKRNHHIAHVHKKADGNSKKSELYEKPGTRVTINEDSQGSMIDESATDDGEVASTKHDIARNEMEQHSDEFKTCTDAACDESGEVDTSEWVILKKHRNKNGETTNYVSENDVSEKTSIETESEHPSKKKNSSMVESITSSNTSSTKDIQTTDLQHNEKPSLVIEETKITNLTLNKTDHKGKETDEKDDMDTSTGNKPTIMDQLANAVQQNIETTADKENCTEKSCFTTEEKENNNAEHEESTTKETEESNDTESALTESTDKETNDEKHETDKECTDEACTAAAAPSQTTDNTGDKLTNTDDSKEESESTEQAQSTSDAETIDKEGKEKKSSGCTDEVCSSASSDYTEVENTENNKENATFVRDGMKNDTKQEFNEMNVQNNTKVKNATKEGETKSKNECTDAACMAPEKSTDQTEAVNSEENGELGNESAGSGSDEQDLQNKQNETKKVEGYAKEKLTEKPTTEDESDNVNVVQKKKEKSTNKTVSLLPSTFKVHEDDSDKSILDNGTAEFLSEVLPKTSETQEDSTGNNRGTEADKKHTKAEENSTNAEEYSTNAEHNVQTKQGDSRTFHPFFMKNKVKSPNIHKVQSVSD